MRKVAAVVAQDDLHLGLLRIFTCAVPDTDLRLQLVEPAMSSAGRTADFVDRWLRACRDDAVECVRLVELVLLLNADDGVRDLGLAYGELM